MPRKSKFSLTKNKPPYAFFNKPVNRRQRGLDSKISKLSLKITILETVMEFYEVKLYVPLPWVSGNANIALFPRHPA